MLTLPKDTARLKWTRHIKNKMVFYHLSAAHILRIFRKPDRVEEGIAPDTIAAMKSRKKGIGGRVKGTDKTEEIWIMYKISGKKLNPVPYTLNPRPVTMISAWRYPGKTKPGERPPIPEDILQELGNELGLTNA